MPRRITEFRLLSEALRVYLSEVVDDGHDRWPKYKELFRFLRETLDWCGSEREYKALKKNGTSPAPLVEGLLEYLCRNSPRTVADFLERVGSDCDLRQGPEELIEEFSASCDESQIRNDWRGSGWRSLSEMFAAALIGVDERSLCRTPAEVEQLACRVMTDVGRALAGDLLGTRPGDARGYLARGETHMKRSVEAFQAQAVGWWRACPWSVLKAMYGDEPVGGSIVLPLRPEVYARVRSGQLSDVELSPDCLQYPSRWLLGEGIVSSIPEGTGVRVGWASARQMTTIIYQVARMSYAAKGESVAGQPIRVTCVGGTPDAIQRLKRHGYRHVGILAGFDVSIYELIIPAPERQGWLPLSAAQAYSGMMAVCHARIRHEEG